MKVVIKRLVCSMLLILVLVASVPASLVSALEIDFDQIDWDALGDIFGLTDEQIEDLKETVENLDEEELDEIIEDAKNQASSGEGSGEGSGETVVNYYVAVLGSSTRYFETLSQAVAAASKSDVIFVMDKKGLDAPLSASCQLIFDSEEIASELVVAQDYAVVEGSYVFGSTTYPLYVISKVSDTLSNSVSNLNKANPAYSASLANNGNDQYVLTLTLNAYDVEALANDIEATANDIASAIMPAFPLFDNICVEGIELYNGKNFDLGAIAALVNGLFSKQNPNGIYQMAYTSGNTLYTFPMSMEYHDGAYEVQMDVVVKVDATDAQLSVIKSAMQKTYSRLYLENLGDNTVAVNLNATGLIKEIAEKAGYGAYYDLVTEDGIRAFLDDCKVSWVCEQIMSYNGSAYAEVADAVQKVVNRFMQTNEYATAKDKTFGEAYVGNGVYEFIVDGGFDYSPVLQKIAETSSAYGFDYSALVEMCGGKTYISGTVAFSITAYNTTLEESASNVVDGVLDALAAVSGDTAYRIDRTYTDGILSGIDFVLQPGLAVDIFSVINKENAIGVLESLIPVYLVFDEASVNGNLVYDKDGAVALRSALLNVYNSQPLNFSTVANMNGDTLLTYDLQLVYGDVVLNIPVSLSIGTSDENIEKLKSVAAKLADIVTVDADLTSSENEESLYLDVTVDLSDDIDEILTLLLPDIATDSYDYVRNELHALTLQSLLDNVTLANLQNVAEKAGFSEQFNMLVTKLANKFGLDTSDPCNYEDLIAILDANYYYQTYVKEALETKLAQYDIASILAGTVGDYYQNDGTYVALLGDKEDGVVLTGYFDRVIEYFKNKFVGEEAEKALAKLGYASVDELIAAFKNRFASLYNAKYDVDVKLTLILFDTYEVTFVDEEGNVIETQTVVAGDMAADPYYHGGAMLGVYYDADVDYDNVLSDLVVTLTPIHTYDDGVVTIPEGCETEGVMTYTCIYCDDYYEETIDAAGHTWYLFDQADPTCTAQGYLVIFCGVCGEIEITYEDALGHAWEETSRVEATCTEQGYVEYTCSACGETYRDILPTVGEHDFVGVYTEATCLEDGYWTYTCSACDESYTVIDANTAIGHNFVPEVTTEPTCTAEGVATHTCLNCGHSFTTIVPATGHKEDSEWIVDAEATCTENGSKHTECSVCGETMTTETIPATGHTEGSEWIVDVEATCTENGSKHTECSVCGEPMTTETIPATGHTEGSEWIVDAEATCTENGSKHTACTVCGEAVTTETIPAIGHNYVETETEGSDCHHPHSKKNVCSNCGDSKDESTTDVYYPPLKEDVEPVVFLSKILVVKVEEMTVTEFKSYFYCDITVYNQDGKELTGNQLVGTNGTFVCGECGTSFTIAVIGDVNGDGDVTARDYMEIKRHVLQTYELTGAALAAADVDVGLAVDARDYMMIKLYVLQKYDFYTNVPDWDTVSHLVTDDIV